MSYFTIVTDVAGQGGQRPRRVKIVTSDNLATVTTAGYLNRMSPESVILPTDIIDMTCSYSTLTQSGTYECLVVSTSGSSIVLEPWVDQGNVVLPVVGGNLASFTVAEDGTIEDSGFSETDFIHAVGLNQNVTTANSTATIGTTYGLKCNANITNATVTSGEASGASSNLELVGASGGTFYGIKGRVHSTGTIPVSNTVFLAGSLSEVDLTNITIQGSANISCIYGHISGAVGSGLIIPGMHAIYFQNDSRYIPESVVKLVTPSDILFDLNDAGSVVSYFATAGTTAGSAGDTSKCNASKVLSIKVNGTAYFVPLFASNS